jgi:hypothetical protein
MGEAIKHNTNKLRMGWGTKEHAMLIGFIVV